MTAPEIYTEVQARYIMSLAVRHDQCAELLNVLADGGCPVVPGQPGERLSFVSAEQVKALAAGLDPT